MFSDQPNCYNPFFYHIKKPSDQNPPPLFTFQDSSLFDQHELVLLSINHQVLLQENNSILPSPDEKQVGMIPGVPSIRRRAGKKDRHSKICTAQGIRDRRMRLSLQIARKFFDLQDMLGYDKASKTIEWLFTKSKKAIKELIKQHPQYYDDDEDDAKSESFVSECEVMSGQPTTIQEEREERGNPKGGSKPNDPRLASREKARARARWRTREKMIMRILEGSGNYNSNKSSNPSYDKYGFDQKLGFLNGPMFEGVDRGSSLNNQERVPLCGNIYGDVGTIEKFLGNSSMSCPNYSEYQNRAVSDHNMDPNRSFTGFFGSC